MVVDAAVEDGRRVLADARVDQRLAARVVLDEVADVVDDARDGDERAPVLGLGHIVVPADDGQLLERGTPVEGGALLVDLLLQLLQAALLDLVGLELLQVVGEAELLPDPDGPLGGVVLVPVDGIAVVGGELVVKVVVALAERREGGDVMITGRVAVVEWLVTEPVGDGVDAEGRLLDNEDPEDSGVDEATLPVSPSETADEHGEDHSHEDDGLQVVAMLPDDDGVIVEVGDVGAADALWVLLHDHPSEMRVEETLADGIWVLVGVGVSVVSTMVSRPPPDGALDGTATHGGEEDLEGKRRGVGAVRPETMVA